ncbi:MAG: hypothetical protein HYZ73_08640 [Elusimicrobia bacterium]|nr:hypothetical protein [Elusimicrobiota bacterium]
MQDRELDQLFKQIQDVEPDARFRARLWARIGEEEASRLWWRWPRLIPLAAGVAMAWLIGFSVAAWLAAPEQLAIILRPRPISTSATARATRLLTVPVGENSLVQVYQGRL